MTTQRDALSIVIALQFVVAAAVVFLFVPYEAAKPLVPLAVLLALALLGYRYRS